MKKALRRGAAVAAAAAASVTLHGCDVPHVEGYWVVTDFDVATQRLPTWRMMEDYWTKSSYKDPQTGRRAFNSCANPRLSMVEVCSGHGRCTTFVQGDMSDDAMRFCKCDPAWAGMECNVRRRKQSIAWFLSLLFGPLALDEMYLGRQPEAMMKLVITIVGSMVGAFGLPQLGLALVAVPWMFDVVRIGLSPVLAVQYTVEPDLSKFAFAIFTVSHFCMLAFLLGLSSMYHVVLARRRRHDQMLCYGAAVKVIA